LSSPVIELRNISKIYRMSQTVSVEALKDVNVKIYPGEIVIIMGPSGSGKSTFLNIVGTLDRPTSGRVYLEGVDVTDLPERELYDIRLRKIGFVFQFFNLISTLTAIENVMLPMILLGELSEKEARERALELLKIVGLGDRINSRPIQLSGGQQQRVAIARALANNPSIVLMDEPTGNVDVVSEAIILKLVSILNKYFGVTFVIVTHNPEVSVIGHRIIYIRGGRLFETKEVPKISLDQPIDERRIIRSELKFLKLELVRLRKELHKGIISRDEYLARAREIEEKVHRIRRLISNAGK